MFLQLPWRSPCAGERCYAAHQRWRGRSLRRPCPSLRRVGVIYCSAQAPPLPPIHWQRSRRWRACAWMLRGLVRQFVRTAAFGAVLAQATEPGHGSRPVKQVSAATSTFIARSWRSLGRQFLGGKKGVFLRGWPARREHTLPGRTATFCAGGAAPSVPLQVIAGKQRFLRGARMGLSSSDHALRCQPSCNEAQRFEFFIGLSHSCPKQGPGRRREKHRFFGPSQPLFVTLTRPPRLTPP